MKISETFLVNTKNFEAIINALTSYEANEQAFSTDLLEKLGYSDPNDLLIIRLLKELNVINHNGEPAENFEEFRNPETTKTALTRGLINAYSGLFKKRANIHHSTPEEIQETFEEVFAGRKTNLVIKYISGTFHQIVSYCGPSTIDDVLNQSSNTEGKMARYKTKQNYNKNGDQKIENKPAKGFPEEAGDKTIDRLMNDLSAALAKQEKPPKNGETVAAVKEFNPDKKEEYPEIPFTIDNKNPEEGQMITNNNHSDEDPFDLNGSQPAAKTTNNQKPDNNQQFIQKALIRKGELLHKMQRWESLLPTLEEIIGRFDNDGHAHLEEAVSRSIIRRAIVLLKLKRTKEALSALDAVIIRFKDSKNEEFYGQASMAMLYKAQILESNKSSDLLPLYNAIIERIDSTPEPLMKQKVDQIHLKRFSLIIANGTQPEILDASCKMIERFKDSEQHREYLQKAMIQRAEILDQMNRDEEALKAYDEFLAAFA